MWNVKKPVWFQVIQTRLGIRPNTVALLIAHPNHFGEQREEGEKGEEDFSFPFGSII